MEVRPAISDVVHEADDLVRDVPDERGCHRLVFELWVLLQEEASPVDGVRGVDDRLEAWRSSVGRPSAEHLTAVFPELFAHTMAAAARLGKEIELSSILASDAVHGVKPASDSRRTQRRYVPSPDVPKLPDTSDEQSPPGRSDGTSGPNLQHAHSRAKCGQDS